MRPEDLLTAMSEIDEDLIHRSGTRKQFSWKPILAMAACLILLLGIGTTALTMRNSRNTLQVAMLYTSGGETDSGYECAAEEALSAYYGDYKLEYTHYTCDPVQRTEVISNAVSEGCELVLLDGRQDGAPLLSVAEQYPETTFLALGVSERDLSPEELPHNIICIDYKPEIAGYLAGYTAVKEGYTKLGYYYDLGVDSYFAYGSGYLQGIEAAAKEMGITHKVQVRISSTYTLPEDSYCLTADTNRLTEWYKSGTQMVLACGELSSEAAGAAAEYCGGDAILVGGVKTAQDSQALLSWSITQILDTLLTGGSHNKLAPMPYYTLNDPDGTWGFQNVSEEAFSALRDSLINGKRPCKAEMVTAEECSIQVLFPQED